MSGPFERQRRRAVDALAKRVRERDASGVPHDAELFAIEFMTALCGQGWRPIPALQPPTEPTSTDPVSRPTARPEVAEALARCAAASEQFRIADSNPERSH